MRKHTQLDTLAGKESEGVGAAIKAGPIGEGWRGAARGMGAHPDPGAQRRGSRVQWGLRVWHPLFSRLLPSSLLLGEPRPPARGAGNRSRIRPMWSAAGVPDRRSPPTQALAQALKGDYACCRLREGSFPSRRRDGCAFPRLKGSCRPFNACLFFAFSEGEICNESCAGETGLKIGSVRGS